MQRYNTQVIRYFIINGEIKEAGTLKTFTGWDREEKADRFAERCRKLGFQVLIRNVDTMAKELEEMRKKYPRATYAGCPGDKCFGGGIGNGIRSGFGADMYY
jgi:hypothetical protein